MKYLKKFNTHSEYEDYIGGGSSKPSDPILILTAGTYTGQELIDAVLEAGVFDKEKWYFEIPEHYNGIYNVYYASSSKTYEIYCPTPTQLFQYSKGTTVSSIRYADNWEDGCFIFTNNSASGSISDLSAPLEIIDSAMYETFETKESAAVFPNVSICVDSLTDPHHVHYNPIKTQANNEIWYTTSDNLPIKEFNSYNDRFFGGENGDIGLDLVSNTYSNGLGILTLGGEITRIGHQRYAYAFDNCDNLVSLIFPKSTKFIERAVTECDDVFTSVVIPENVISIQENAFDYCDNLQKVTILATTPPQRTGGTSTLYDIFGNRTNPQHIYVPADSVDAYKSASILSKHYSVVEPI